MRFSACIQIRPGRPDDAARLHDLHTAAVRILCAAHYPREILDGWLLGRTPDGYLPPIKTGAIFVAERGSKVLGFGEAASGVVVAVYVDPSAGQQGIGSDLLADVSIMDVLAVRIAALLLGLAFLLMMVRLWKMRRLSKEEEKTILSRFVEERYLHVTKTGFVFFAVLCALCVLGTISPVLFPGSEVARLVVALGGADNFSFLVFLILLPVGVILSVSGFPLTVRKTPDVAHHAGRNAGDP